MSDPAQMRAADAEREQLAEELREHMLAGRITAEEFEQRLEGAYAASTRGELEALKTDLPMSPAVLERELARRRRRLRRRLVQEAGGAATLSLVCVAIWAAGNAHGHEAFWPVWVILATMLPVVRNAWRLLGPAPDLDSLETNMRRREARRLRRSSRHAHRRELSR